MLKKTITFEDFEGNMITEHFYFNLNKGELTEMAAEMGDGLEESIRKMVETKDAVNLISTLKGILKRAYGIRSEDGRRFIKTDQAWEEFEQTNAFGELFFELVTDVKKLSDFVVGMLPGDFDEKMAQLQAKQAENSELTVLLPEKTERALSDYSDKELVEMSHDEFDRLVKRNKGAIPYRVLQIGMRRRTDKGVIS